MRDNKFNLRFMEAAPKNRAGSDDVLPNNNEYDDSYISNFNKFDIREINKIVNSIGRAHKLNVFDNEVIIYVDKNDKNQLIGIIIGGGAIRSNRIQKRALLFLNSCGLDTATKTENGEYEFDLRQGNKVADNCIKFFYNLQKRLPKAMDSYNITKDMDDRDYNIYKGNLPSEATLSWSFNCCGKDFSYKFYTIDNNHALVINDILNEKKSPFLKFPIEPNKLVKMLLNDNYINLEDLINNADRDLLNAIRAAYDIDADDDEQNVGDYFVRDTIDASYVIDTPVDEDGEIYTIESIKDVCDFIFYELDPYGLITQNNIVLKKDVNDARAKKLKKHPELRTQYESKKSFFERLLNE